MLLLLWIAALNYRPHQPYIPQLPEDDGRRWIDADDEEWLILHVTGHEWL
jgi:hypothetical protein